MPKKNNSASLLLEKRPKSNTRILVEPAAQPQLLKSVSKAKSELPKDREKNKLLPKAKAFERHYRLRTSVIIIEPRRKRLFFINALHGFRLREKLKAMHSAPAVRNRIA